MLKAVTWCAKCLFFYLVVVILAIRFAWVFTLPVFSIATRFHWTKMSVLAFSLSYFLPIFAAVGFLIGLIPFNRLGRAFVALAPRFASTEPKTGLDAVPAILWAWLPVTIAFLIRYLTWHSRNTSVIDPHAITTGRFARFFGTLNMQNPSLLDAQWGNDRFVFTGPMLFLVACALAVLIRHRLTHRQPVTAHEILDSDN